MSKTQKIMPTRWALTAGLIFFAVQPGIAAPKKPKQATTTPTPVAADDSEIGYNSDRDDQSSRQMQTVTQGALKNEQAIAAAPLGSQERADLERKRQEFVGQSDALVAGCPSCPATLTNGAMMAAKMGESLKSPEFTAKAQDLADRAVNAAQQATSDPKQADKMVNALNTRGTVALDAKNYAQAYQDSQRVLKLDPGNKTALFLQAESRGRAAAGSRAPGQAAATAPPPTAPVAPPRPKLAMTDTRSMEARPLIDQSDNFLKLHDYRSALDAAIRAAALAPNNGDAYMHQAIALAALKQLGEALKVLDRAIDKFSEFGPKEALPSAHNLRASYKNAGGDYQGAKDDAGKAVGLDPQFADAYYQRSKAETKLGQKAESIADLKDAAKYAPDRYQALYLAAAQGAEDAPQPAPRFRPAPTLWSRLTDASGGLLPLAVGAAGALFVIFAAYVLFFAKDSARRSRFARWTTPGAEPDALSAAADGRPFQISPKYLRGRRVGSGGMGDVFEGQDNELRRRVAIKSLRAELQTRPRERERFVEEARKVAALHHPHIIEIYDIVQTEAGTFIVFEYVEGQTLHDKRQSGPRRRMDPKTALRYLRQAAEAVDHAHKRGVVHRDLKPSNIMVDEHDRVKVMDFGIARFVQDTMRAIETNTIVGTPPYMAPEQSMGRVSKASDLYALAVSFYELLSGELPFAGDDMSSKVNREFIPLSQRAPELPAAVDAVIAKALDPDPENRHKTCMEFFEAAAAAFDQKTTPAAG